MTDSRPLAAAIGGVSLIGAPTDIGAGTLGARMGPAALRVAGIAQAVAQFGIDVRDCGNLDGPANPWQDAVDGFRHLPEVVAWNRLLHDAVFAELSDARVSSSNRVAKAWYTFPIRSPKRSRTPGSITGFRKEKLLRVTNTMSGSRRRSSRSR